MFNKTQPEDVQYQLTQEDFEPQRISTPRFGLNSQRGPRYPKKNVFPLSAPQTARYYRPSTSRFHARATIKRSLIEQRQPDPESELILNKNSDLIQSISARVLLGEEITEDDPNILGLVIVDLINRRNRLEKKGEFSESLHAQECANKVKEMQLEAKKEQAKRIALMDLEIRKGHTETDATIFEHKYEAEKVKIELRFDEMERRVRSRHQKMLDDYNEEWKTEKKNLPYTHLSSKLRDMKEMVEKLLKSKRFGEAAKLREEVKALEEEETKAMQERRSVDYNRGLKSLIRRQEEELATLNDTKQAKLDMLKKKAENGEAIIENRKKALKYNEEIANDKEKLWKLKHRNDQCSENTIDISIKKSNKGLYSSAPNVKTLKLPPLAIKNTR